MTLSRKYIPSEGKHITLKLFSDYREWMPNETVWAHLSVIHVDLQDGIVAVEVLNGLQQTGRTYNVPLSIIAPPIGWQPRYTIHVKPDQVEKVLGWFARGIVVRQSHDMSGSMPTAFQPMDNSEQPHWQFCEVTDAVQAEDCPRVFRVVKIEREEINFVYNTDCPHCKGTGRRTLAELAEIRKESIEEIKRKMVIPVDRYRATEALPLDQYDGETETFDCACRYGHFRAMGRSKRARLIKEWERDGWTVRYIPYAGGFWERSREIVVRDWEKE